VRRALFVTCLLIGCSSADGAGDDGPPPPYTSRRPPARPTATPSGGTTRWFAVYRVYLGFTARGSAPKDPNAWKEYGFDLDSRNTTAEDSATSRRSCKRKQGSLTRFLEDGNDGIDNNFGQHVLSTIQSFKADSEEFANDGITSGRYTLILKLENATDGDNSKVPGAMYLGGDFAGGAARPTFTASDKWPINPLSLADGKTIVQPKVKFPNGYIRNSTWVSGEAGAESVDLGPMLSGSDVSLPVESALVVMKLDGSDGTIAGAVNTAKLQAGLAPVARRLGLCEGNTAYQEVVKTLSLAADLVAGAPQLQDTAVECDAISLGYGFAMKPTGEPAALMTAATEPAPDTCK